MFEVVSLNNPEHFAIAYQLASTAWGLCRDDSISDPGNMVSRHHFALIQGNCFAALCRDPLGIIYLEAGPCNVAYMHFFFNTPNLFILKRTLKQFVDDAFSQMGVRKLRLIIPQERRGANWVALQLGFNIEGILEDEATRDGEPLTMISYALTKETNADGWGFKPESTI